MLAFMIKYIINLKFLGGIKNRHVMTQIIIFEYMYWKMLLVYYAVLTKYWSAIYCSKSCTFTSSSLQIIPDFLIIRYFYPEGLIIIFSNPFRFFSKRDLKPINRPKCHLQYDNWLAGEHDWKENCFKVLQHKTPQNNLLVNEEEI